MVFLELWINERRLQRLPLPADTAVIVGRLPSDGPHLMVPDRGVSGRHAEVKLIGDRILLTDLESTHGTVVDGRSILPNQPEELSDGSTVKIGAHELRIVFEESAPPPAPLPSESEQLLPPPPAPSNTLDPIPSEPPPPLHARARFPPDLPAGASSRWIRYLPDIYQDQEFLGRMLFIFEAIWEPLETRLDHIADYFDPRSAPSELLPWLASWTGLELPRALPEPRLRALLMEAEYLMKWRGSALGLSRLLELATGKPMQVELVAEHHGVIRVRPIADEDWFIVEELVRRYKPAHLAYILERAEA